MTASLLKYWVIFFPIARSINNYMHPTESPLTFILYFSSSAQSVFADSAALNTQIAVSTSCPNGETMQLSSTWSYYGNSEEIAFLVLGTTYIPIGCEMNVNFPATTPSLSNTNIEINLEAYTGVASSLSQLISTLTSVNFYSGIAALGVNGLEMLFHPYSILYLYSKMVIETIDILKMANLKYESFLVSYLENNNNKISGLRVPNLFSILLQGDSFDSGYSRNDWFVSISTRESDFGAEIFNPVYNYSVFPMFIDMFGEQLTVLIGLFTLAMLISAIKSLGNNTEERREENKYFVAVLNFFRFNFLIANFLGGFQTGFFYAVIQIMMYTNSGSIGHNSLNLWFAVCSLTLGFFAMIFIGWLLLQLTDTTKIERGWKAKYQVLFGIYETGNLPPWFILIVIFRNLILVSAILYNNTTGLVQSIILLIAAVPILFILIFMNVIKQNICYWTILVYELLTIAYTICMLINGISDNSGNYEDSSRTVDNAIQMFISCLLPCASCLGGLAGLIWGYKPQLLKSNTIMPIKDTERKKLDETSDKGGNNSVKDSMLSSSIDNKRIKAHNNEDGVIESHSEGEDSQISEDEKKKRNKAKKKSSNQKRNAKKKIRPPSSISSQKESTLDPQSTIIDIFGFKQKEKEEISIDENDMSFDPKRLGQSRIWIEASQNVYSKNKSMNKTKKLRILHEPSIKDNILKKNSEIEEVAAERTKLFIKSENNEAIDVRGFRKFNENIKDIANFY